MENAQAGFERFQKSGGITMRAWRENAQDYFARDDDGLGWCGREGQTIFEWLEARNLPPIPRDESRRAGGGEL